MNGRPVFAGELRKTARQARTYAFRTTFLLLVLFVAVSVVASALWVMPNNPQASLANLGKALYVAFVLTMGAAVALLATPYAAGIVAGERERQTLSVLLASDLSSVEIVSDKLMAQLSLIGLTILGILPISFACLILGGVSWWQLLGGVSLVIGLLLFCSGVGVFFSAICTGTVGAVLRSYIAVAAYLIGVPFFTIVLGESRHLGRGFETYVISTLVLINPLVSLAELIVPGAPVPAFLAGRGWISVVILSFLVFLVGSAVAAMRLRDESPSLFRRREKRGGKRRARQRRERRVWPNPVLWRAAQVGRATRPAWILFLVYLLLAVIADPCCFASPHFHRTTICGEVCLLVICLVVGAAAAIAGERERRTLRILISTPFDSSQIVAGKALGILLRHWLLVLLPIGHTALCVLCGVFHPASLSCVAVNSLVLGVLFLLLGLLVSTLYRSSWRAMFLSLAILFCLAALMPLYGETMDKRWLARLSPIGMVENSISVGRSSELPRMLRQGAFWLATGAYSAVAIGIGGILFRKSEALLRLYA